MVNGYFSVRLTNVVMFSLLFKLYSSSVFYCYKGMANIMIRLLSLRNWNPSAVCLNYVYTAHGGLDSWTMHLFSNAAQVNYLEAGNVSLLIGGASCLLIVFLI